MSYYNSGLYGGWAPQLSLEHLRSVRGDIMPQNLIEAYMTRRYHPDKEYRKAAKHWMMTNRRNHLPQYTRAGRLRNTFLNAVTKTRRPKMTRAGRNAIWNAWSTASPTDPINAHIAYGDWAQANLDPYQQGGGGTWRTFVQEMFRHVPFLGWYTANGIKKPLALVAAYWRSLTPKPSSLQDIAQAVSAWTPPTQTAAAAAAAAQMAPPTRMPPPPPSSVLEAALGDDEDIEQQFVVPQPPRPVTVIPQPPRPKTVKTRKQLKQMMRAASMPETIYRAIVSHLDNLYKLNDRMRQPILYAIERTYGLNAAHWANALI